LKLLKKQEGVFMNKQKVNIIGIVIGFVIILIISSCSSAYKKNSSQKSYKELTAEIVGQVDISGVDVGFPENLKWSPNNDTIFAFQEDYSGVIIIYQVINSDITKVAEFKGYYNRFKWSKSGKHLIVAKRAERYDITSLTTLVSLNIQT
jgi:hypothetical protein